MQVPGIVDPRLIPGPGQLALSPQAPASCTFRYLLKPSVGSGRGLKDGPVYQVRQKGSTVQVSAAG